MSDFESMIRDKLAEGTLPRQDCRMTWYEPGRGGLCEGCEETITPDEVEVECDLGHGRTIRLHQRCHEFWMREWRSP